eukprot:TRINITY_DN9209_c0_g1_i2.p1 TRINITY_DN9209_c0_g1~~TRINITY_DN9209_c0_g1_i2.p1  ORF type:complete len:375 (+),score=51.01 TRINITY_DN9209_c0_g1_i2:125-1126(+)
MASAAFNTILCFGSSVLWLSILWGCNGFVQGFGWAPIAMMIRDTFSDPSQRATWWSLVSTSQNVGAGLSPMLITAMVTTMDSKQRSRLVPPGMDRLEEWQLAFLLPAIIVFSLTPLLYPLLPQTRMASPKDANTSDNRMPSLTQIPRRMLFLLASSVAIYLAKDTLSNWTLFILHQDKGFDRHQAATCLGFFEAGGVVGSLAAGAISDKVFGGRRGPVCVLYGLGFAGSVALLNVVEGFQASCAAMAVAGAFLFGPQTLMGLFAMELAPAHMAGLAGSLVSVSCQIGAALGGYPISVVKGHYGSGGIFHALSAFGLVWAGLLSFVWNSKQKAA